MSSPRLDSIIVKIRPGSQRGMHSSWRYILRKQGPSSPLDKPCIVSSSSTVVDSRIKRRNDGIERSSMPMSTGRVVLAIFRVSSLYCPAFRRNEEASHANLFLGILVNISRLFRLGAINALISGPALCPYPKHRRLTSVKLGATTQLFRHHRQLDAKVLGDLSQSAKFLNRVISVQAYLSIIFQSSWMSLVC